MTQKQLIERMTEIYNLNIEIARNKNADYSGSDDAFKNFRRCEEMGIATTEQGFLVRLTDKLARIATLTKQEGKVKDETVLDTLQDLANYAILMRVYLESKK